MTMKQAASSAPSLGDCMRRDHHPLPNWCRCRNGSRRLRQWRTARAGACGLLRGPRRSCCASRETWPSCMATSITPTFSISVRAAGGRAIDPRASSAKAGSISPTPSGNPAFRVSHLAGVVGPASDRHRRDGGPGLQAAIAMDLVLRRDRRLAYGVMGTMQHCRSPSAEAAGKELAIVDTHAARREREIRPPHADIGPLAGPRRGHR